jgi:hypothetical protein
MMKTPTAKYRFDICSLRNKSASDIVFALANLCDRPECNEISLVQYGDLVSYPAGAMHIVGYYDQCRAALRFAAHEKFIDFSGRDAV